MGVIPSPIPQQAFERLRTRIFQVISDELFQQAAINYDDELDANVFVERFVPIGESEMPAVNISYDGTTYPSQSHEAANGLHSFSIDVYAKAKTSTDNRGDFIARQRLHRLVGILRAILMDTRYITLGFSRPSISGTAVTDIKIADPI